MASQKARTSIIDVTSTKLLQYLVSVTSLLIYSSIVIVRS